MNLKKLSVLLLGLALLVATIAACGGGDDNSAAQTTASNDAVETTTAETTTGELQPDLPDMDFGGEDFVMLTSGETDSNGADWQTYDVWAEAENGDVINDAVYERNMYLTDTYNVVIEEVQSEGTTYNMVNTFVLAGEDIYDAVMTNLRYGAQLASIGYLYDLFEVPYIDLEQPWWDTNLAHTLSVANRMHFATGDITVMDNDAIWVLMFNKNMVEDYGLENIYTDAINGDWYYDDFLNTSKSVASDLNGDGEMTWQDDRFSFTTGKLTGITSMYTCNCPLTSKDSDDIPKYTFDLDRATTIAETFGELLTSKDVLVSDSVNIMPEDIRHAFEEGRALFFGEVLQCIQRMRSSETDFGLIPWPKFDETQDNYSHVAIASAAKCITIPVTNTDIETAGFVLEAMAAKSKYTLTPAYYEIALTSKYMRDEESVAMLDIILDTLAMDLAFVNDWGSITTTIENNVWVNTGNFVSTIESNLSAFDVAMQKTIDAYLDSAE